MIGTLERINLSVYEDKCLLALSEGVFCSVIYNPREQRTGPRDYPTDLRDVVGIGTPGECKMVGKPRV